MHADISGNVNQDEFWAILDDIDSDVEENIDNLLVDSDTDDAADVINSSTLVHLTKTKYRC